MGYVAATADLFALGAWAGHDLAGGVGIVAFIAACSAKVTFGHAGTGHKNNYKTGNDRELKKRTSN